MAGDPRLHEYPYLHASLRRRTRPNNYPAAHTLSHAEEHARRAVMFLRPGGWSTAEEPVMRCVELAGSDGSGPKKVVIVSIEVVLSQLPDS